ncbi:MAG: hypothetical protein Fur0012_01000 [Elusimicrobiota bacterium]
MTAAEAIKEKFNSVIVSAGSCAGQDFITIKKEALIEVSLYLKNNMNFEFLSDLTCVDYKGYPGWEHAHRFEMVYQFYSYERKERMRIKVPVEETSPWVESLTGLWQAANWYEREVYDMYGINFSGHPDLRRILMYDEFIGHPLRKDYPLKGRQPRISHED